LRRAARSELSDPQLDAGVAIATVVVLAAIVALIIYVVLLL
jgi:hypothetical protein